MTVVTGVAAALIVALVPGVCLFRLPVLRRELRAALPIEERWFWQIVLSLVWSVGLTLALAAVSLYSFPRLLAANLALAALVLVAWRGRLLWHGAAAKPTVTLLIPIALMVFGIWRFTPAAEYVIGGKDPGIYINEGVNLQRTGTLFRKDAVVAAVPPEARDLFFPNYDPTEYYGIRFMGVFLNDPTTGEVIPQFPHLLYASIALGYGLGGIRGAMFATPVWAVLGLLAVYLFGTRLVGRGPAFFACVLLALNVIEVWYGRYPNAEVVMQTFLFAGLLALSHTWRDGDRYFGWVTGALAAALVFLRFDAYLAIVPAVGAAALVWIVERRAVGWPAAAFLVVASVLAGFYYTGPMKAYFWQYKENLPTLATGLIGVGASVLLILGLGTLRTSIGPRIKSLVPPVLAVAVIGLAMYAMFFRHPGGRLAPWDAYAFRSFRDAYVFWPAIVAGLAGFGLLVWRRFWQEPAFFLVFAAFCTFLFYKIRVVPEQFWMARRFLPVILPGLLLLAAAAALGVAEGNKRRSTLRRLAGIALLGFIGWQYAVAAAPVAAHVEYKGAVRLVERLASETTERDLVIFESRNSGSDVHVLAVPLAYIHGRNALVFHAPLPDRRVLETFLEGATSQYERVLFVASAGTDMLSKRIRATPLAFVTAVLPEYATTSWDEYPAGARQKDLGYSVYQLTVSGGPEPAESGNKGFVLDVGYFDELHVLRFRAREVTEGRTFRWTGAQSFIAVTGLAGTETVLTLTMHDGGRPANAPRASVELFFNNVALGTVMVETGFRDYKIALPPELVRLAAAATDPAQLRLLSSTWRPMDFLGGTDDRVLGVMIDRVEIH